MWNSSINRIFLGRLSIHLYKMLPITGKTWSKAKYSTLNPIRFEFVKKTSIPNPVEKLSLRRLLKTETTNYQIKSTYLKNNLSFCAATNKSIHVFISLLQFYLKKLSYQDLIKNWYSRSKSQIWWMRKQIIIIFAYKLHVYFHSNEVFNKNLKYEKGITKILISVK